MNGKEWVRAVVALQEAVDLVGAADTGFMCDLSRDVHDAFDEAINGLEEARESAINEVEDRVSELENAYSDLCGEVGDLFRACRKQALKELSQVDLDIAIQEAKQLAAQ